MAAPLRRAPRADLERAELPTKYKGALIDTRVFRRSFATWLEAHGVPGTHIDRLLGHAQQTVRGRHYSAADLVVLRSAVETIRLDLAGEPGHESEPAKVSESSAESSERDLAATGTDGYTTQNQEVAPVAQWIEQRFPKGPDALDVDHNRADIAGNSEKALPAVADGNHATAGEKTIPDDSVERALAAALERASAAREWAAVATLAKELESRRLARSAPNVVAIDRKSKGGGQR
jgi:hypothetical protein